jgi:uncharacterized protein (DUF433 family)
MSLTITDLPVPIRVDEHGTARIGKTRVTLDTLVVEFEEGATPEQIVQDFDTLDLADVYAVMAFYLGHRPQVEEYLKEQDQKAQAVRQKIAALIPPPGLRERLLARRARQEVPDAEVRGR